MFKHLTLLMVLLCFQLGAQERELHVGVFENHQSYVRVASSYGLGWQVFELAANKANVKLILSEDAWVRSIDHLKKGKVDLVFSAVKNKERAQWALFTLPVSMDYLVILANLRNTTKSIKEIDFNNANVGVTKGSIHEKLALDIGFKNIYSTVDRKQIYTMLEHDRLDYIFYSKSIAQYYCAIYSKTEEENCLRVVGNPVQRIMISSMYMPDNSNAIALVKQINLALIELAKEGKIAPLFTQFGVSKEDYQYWLTLLK